MIYDTNGLSGWADGFESMAEIVSNSPRIIVPIVALAEYRFGLRDSRLITRRELWLKEIRHRIEIHPITEATGELYARLAHSLKKKGRKIEQNDIWVAACAFEVGIPIVVSNDTGFDDIDGLKRISFRDPR